MTVVRFQVIMPLTGHSSFWLLQLAQIYIQVTCIHKSDTSMTIEQIFFFINHVHVTLSQPQPCNLQTDVECEALKGWNNTAKIKHWFLHKTQRFLWNQKLKGMLLDTNKHLCKLSFHPTWGISLLTAWTVELFDVGFKQSLPL